MFYIYHINNVKIGCTNNLKKRVEKVQGYKDYKVLAVTDNLNKASQLEIYYQKLFGYKQDINSYLQLMINKNKKSMDKKIHVTKRTLTFKGTTDQALTGYNFPMLVELLDGTHIAFDIKTIEWIKNNNTVSQHSKERFVYINALTNFISQEKTNEVEIFNNIRVWARERGIYDFGDPLTQYCKLMEEAGELAQALVTEKNEKKKVDTIDAIGDMVVVLTNLAELVGVRIEDCVESAYGEIADRKGKMENGTFVKENNDN